MRSAKAGNQLVTHFRVPYLHALRCSNGILRGIAATVFFTVTAIRLPLKQGRAEGAQRGRWTRWRPQASKQWN